MPPSRLEICGAVFDYHDDRVIQWVGTCNAQDILPIQELSCLPGKVCMSPGGENYLSQEARLDSHVNEKYFSYYIEFPRNRVAV